MRLFSYEFSGNCYKTRLFATMLGVPLEVVEVDLMTGEHLKPPVADLNPLCELPILTDGNFTLRDSQAILVYLARKYGGEAWFPTEPSQMALVTQWLGTAAANVNFGPALARGIEHYRYPADKEMTLRISARLLRALETHLKTRKWLELDRPTVADIAVFAYVAMGPEGGVPLAEFQNIRSWLHQISKLPNFFPMAGMSPETGMSPA